MPLNEDTQQTEFSVYLSTLHVVAALILLNGRLAVGTRFGVGQQPQAVSSILIGLAHTCHCGKAHTNTQVDAHTLAISLQSNTWPADTFRHITQILVT